MRYIDADALIKKIYPMGIGDGKYTINAKAVKLAIDNTPTADVVPKSEYDRLKKLFKDMTQEAKGYLNRLYGIRADVAREIFEEIELFLNKAIDGWRKEISFACDSRKIEMIDFRIGAFKYCLYEIAELKKKYTEGGKC